MKQYKNIFSALLLCCFMVASSACSEEKFGPDPSKDWDNTTFYNSVDQAGFQTYYNPGIGRCGDPMPFYDAKAGHFKVLYLQEFDNNAAFNYHPIWGVSTVDGANYQSLGEVLPTGTSPDEQDAALGTGCCIEKDGIYYIYYTGHDRYGREAVMRATSSDFSEWSKDTQWMLKGSAYGYSDNDFRDPQIFVADVGNFPMIWDRMCECPDIFKMGNYWYLVYSEGYRASWSRKVKYMMAPTWEALKACFNDPGANWPHDGHEGVLDTRAFYAGKTASNGQDRYIWGWCPYRTGNTIHDKNINVGAGGEPNWSGALVCHKIIQHADGTLTVGEVPAIAAKFNNEQNVKVMASNGAQMSGVNGTLSGDDAFVMYNRLGTSNHISFTVTTSNNWDRFGISLVRGTDSDRYYTMMVNPEDENHRKVNFEQEGPAGKGFIEGIDGYWFERPADNVYHINIYTDNSVMVMYINDVCAYTNRIYGIQKNCWSINNYGGNITISDLKVFQ